MQISGLSASNTFSATDVLAIEVNVNGVEKTYKLTGATLAAALASIGSYLKKSDIVNNLTSTATNQPLSAAQGKVLNDKITNKQTLTATTDSAGRIVSDIPFDNVKSANVESKVDYYCACRQSTGGKAVFLVFNGTFQNVLNTQVSLTVWLA